MALATKPRRRSSKQAAKRSHVDAVMGRYAHVRTSSAKFAAEKSREVAQGVFAAVG